MGTKGSKNPGRSFEGQHWEHSVAANDAGSIAKSVFFTNAEMYPRKTVNTETWLQKSAHNIQTTTKCSINVVLQK